MASKIEYYSGNSQAPGKPFLAPRQADYTIPFKNTIMPELVINLHMHTFYSDGFGTHQDIAKAAIRSGLDVVIVTDHNVWVNGLEDYYTEGNKRVLVLVGEEIHDQARLPQKNHLLVFGAGRELAPLAYNTRLLLEGVIRAEGVAFLAHPVDPAAPAIGEGDISWVDWDVQGYTGIELWNGFSEFKSRIKTKLHALYLAYNPRQIAQGPLPATLQIWDRLLLEGKKVAAIGGSDAHAIPVRLGPLRRTIFPYDFHFHAINTHLLIPKPLAGIAPDDRRMIIEAMRRGHAFVGYDLPAPTRGFRFTAQGKDKTAMMGDEISVKYGVTFQIRLPIPAECSLLKNGKVIKSWQNRDTCTYITTEPGIYRVEVHKQFYGRRGWIFSNPIYVTD